MSMTCRQTKIMKHHLNPKLVSQNTPDIPRPFHWSHSLRCWGMLLMAIHWKPGAGTQGILGGKRGRYGGGGFFWEETTEKNEKKVKCDETRIIGREWNIARTEICTKHMIICLICGFGRSPSSGLRGKIVRIRTNHEKNQSVTLVI